MPSPETNSGLRFFFCSAAGNLAPIAAGNAYTTAEIEEIQQFAKENDLEVIPLVQTFGHVEFALKLEKFASLREVPESPQALCPSNNGSIQFVESLIDQVRAATVVVAHAASHVV